MSVTESVPDTLLWSEASSAADALGRALKALSVGASDVRGRSNDDAHHMWVYCGLTPEFSCGRMQPTRPRSGRLRSPPVCCNDSFGSSSTEHCVTGRRCATRQDLQRRA